MNPTIEVRELTRDELTRVSEIDRTERIDVLYVQEGERLTERPGRWDAVPWDPVGDGEHSVAAKVRELHAYLDDGGVALGALIDGRLVGIGVVVPQLRPKVAQLAFLHVSAPSRGAGVGRALVAALEVAAHEAGATEMVVSATPSQHTVRFYLGVGFVPTASPLPELFEREPEDVHLHKFL